MKLGILPLESDDCAARNDEVGSWNRSSQGRQGSQGFPQPFESASAQSFGGGVSLHIYYDFISTSHVHFLHSTTVQKERAVHADEKRRGQ